MMGQDIFDLVVVITLVIFTLRGASNGFVGEVAGIFSLIGGFWAARAWNGVVSPYLDFISDPSLRVIAACALIFIAAMLVIALAARVLKKIIAFSFVAWADKLAGALLGLAKGVLIWALIFIVLDKLFHDQPFMREARSVPYFTAIIDHIRQWLPDELTSRMGI